MSLVTIKLAGALETPTEGRITPSATPPNMTYRQAPSPPPRRGSEEKAMTGFSVTRTRKSSQFSAINPMLAAATTAARAESMANQEVTVPGSAGV